MSKEIQKRRLRIPGGLPQRIASDVTMKNWKEKIPQVKKLYNEGVSMATIATDVFGDPEGTNRTSMVSQIIARLIIDGELAKREEKTIPNIVGKETVSLVQKMINERAQKRKILDALRAIRSKNDVEKAYTRSRNYLKRKNLVEKWGRRDWNGKDVALRDEIIESIKKHGVSATIRIYARKNLGITAGMVHGINGRYVLRVKK